MHHNIFQRLAFQLRHGGIWSGVTHWKQHQQLLVGRTLEEEPELGATI